MSPKYTLVTQTVLRLIFLTCVATTYRFNYGGQESKQEEQTIRRLKFKCNI